MEYGQASMTVGSRFYNHMIHGENKSCHQVNCELNKACIILDNCKHPLLVLDWT